MTRKEQIDQIVAMLDSFAENGGGHMNVTVEEQQDLSCEVTNTFSVDCDKANTACSVPSLHQGIDE